MADRLPCLSLLLAFVAGSAAAQDGIAIYRCTDAAGKLTLQDSPCTQGQSQQTRTMLQPIDPPPEPAPAPEPVALAAAPPPRTVVVHAPQPMYECTRPDGDRYTSDSDGGNPRWISTWVPAYPFVPVYTGIAYGNDSPAPAHSSPRTPVQSPGNGAPQLHFRRVPASPPPPPRPPPRPPHHQGHGFGYSSGRWVRDECHALPQAEVCARLRDRREAIRDRRFNAQQRERETLAREERGISARLAADCGGN